MLPDLKGKGNRIRTVPVPAWVKELLDAFGLAVGERHLINSAFTVTRESDRMGYRLSGEPRPNSAEFLQIAERWRPYRSVASWYLWRSLDPVPVEY